MPESQMAASFRIRRDRVIAVLRAAECPHNYLERAAESSERYWLPAWIVVVLPSRKIAARRQK